MKERLEGGEGGNGKFRGWMKRRELGNEKRRQEEGQGRSKEQQRRKGSGGRNKQ